MFDLPCLLMKYIYLTKKTLNPKSYLSQSAPRSRHGQLFNTTISSTAVAAMHERRHLLLQLENII